LANEVDAVFQREIKQEDPFVAVRNRHPAETAQIPGLDGHHGPAFRLRGERIQSALGCFKDSVGNLFASSAYQSH
jgi:hypothetical protein